MRSDEVAGATFYEITHRVEDDGVCSGIILKAVTGTLRAGRPYIFRRANDSPFLAAALSGELVEEAEARNGLVGTFTPMAAPAGTYLLRHGVLVPADTQGDALLRAGEAYIDISQIAATQTGTEAASIAVQKDRGLIVGLGRYADATRRLSPALPRFDLSGRRATTLRRGLYVTGGRKVIVQ